MGRMQILKRIQKYADMDIMNDFHENLRRLMKKGDFDQAKLAKLSGVSNTLIGRYVRGEKEPTIEYLISLSLGLGCTVDELVGVETISVFERRLLEAYRQLPEGERKQIIELLLLSESFFGEPQETAAQTSTATKVSS